MRASALLACVALLCAARAWAEPSSKLGRTLYVAPDPATSSPRVYDRPATAEGSVRKRRDAPASPAAKSNISTWMNHLNDSHQQLMVHWVGEGSRVIVCLARDPAPRKLSLPAPSSLYISYDYGATFTNKTESFRLGDNSSLYAQLDKFYNHPKYPQYCIFVDATNKVLYYTSDNGVNIGRTQLDFTPSDLAFHQNYPERFLVHDKLDPTKKLYLTSDGGRTFLQVQEFIKSFYWVWTDEDTEGSLFYERMEPSGTSQLIRAQTPAPAAPKTPLLRDMQDFQIKGDFMFATRNLKEGGAQLLISHSRGRFYTAEFETDLPLLKFQVADVTDARVMVTVMHAENNTALYVSHINRNFTQYKFALSLPRVMGYFPYGTWKDSWLEEVAEEAFTDLYRVEGLRGVYVASRVAVTPAQGNIGTEHLASVISFDHGASWGPIAPPSEDENGVPINCRPENSCSLHLSQKFSQLYPVTRSASIMSSKSAPGIIMATGVLGKSMKGIPGVFLSRDAGVTWKRVLKDYYFFNAGDHGGVLVAVKYFKSRGETRRILYSTDEGRTWSSHQFHAEDLRVYGLMTEPGENTTTFTMFGSANYHHQWIIITVDLFNAFARNCTSGDYKLWSPAAPNSSVSCVLGARDTYQRRLAHTNCYNGIDYDRPVKKQVCECSRGDFECDYGFMPSGADCVRNKSVRSDPYAVPADCRPGQFYRRTKGYRKIDGDVCTAADYVPYAPDSIPCPMGETTEFLVVALRDKIARIDLETNETTLFPIQDLKNIVAIEFDLKNNCIYWADIERDKIGRQCLSNGSYAQEIIVETDLASIEGMALDWISNLLFFVDGMRNKIEAVRTDMTNGGRMRRTILGPATLNKPRGIAVHPKAGYLFWTDWNTDNPAISRSNLDGTNIKKLFGKPLVQWPNGITIDQIAERIYWVDAMSDYIASADINGHYLKMVVWNDERVAHPFAVAVLKDRMFWDDWKAGAIFSADKDKGSDIITLPTSNSSLSGLMDLKVFAHFTQHGSNACSWRNTTCGALCVGGPRNTFSCLCPDGLTGKDGHCLCPNGAEPYPNMTCPMKGNTCAPKEWRCANGLCVSESWRCDGDNDCGDGSDEIECAADCLPPLISCDGGRHCLPPHWGCDHELDCLDRTDEMNCHKHNCTGTQFACASGQCIDQKWRCDGDRDCKDGSDEQGCPPVKWGGECRAGDFRCPNSTRCIPYSWKCDGEADCFGGGDESKEMCANSTCSDSMFRCAGNGKCIFKAWVCDGDDDCNDGVGSDEHNCSLATERPAHAPPPHATATNTCLDWMFMCRNGNCLPAWWKCDQINDCGDGSDEQGCDTDMGHHDTSAEHTTHSNQGTCDAYHFTCSPGVCIPLEWVCDTAADCPGGEDELECHYQSRVTGATVAPCGPDDFLCADRSRCVPAAHLCDGKPQCTDRSDEANCPHQPDVQTSSFCLEDEFSCDKGALCLSRTVLCDTRQDCYDGTDEMNCTGAPLYKNLGLGVEQVSITSTGFLISCWLAQQQNVTYSFLPSISKVGSGVWRNVTITHDNVYRFTDLEPFTEYNVTFYVRDSLSNKTLASGIYVNATTRQGEPSPPRSVTVRQQPGRRVMVLWSKPATPRGHVHLYYVYVSPPDPPIPYHSNVESLEIEANFHPRTNYTFWVTAYNGAMESERSAPAVLEFDPMGDVDELANVSVSHVNDSAITLSWNRIRGVEGYVVSLDLPPEYLYYSPVRTAADTVTLTGIPTGVTLSVSVSPYLGAIEGRPLTITLKSRGVREETLEPHGSLMPGDLRSVELHWRPPVGERYRNKTPVYYIYCSFSAPAHGIHVFIEPVMETTNTSAVINNLRPCCSVYFTVGLKGGPMAPPLVFNTGYNESAMAVRTLKAEVNSPVENRWDLDISWASGCDVSVQSTVYHLEVTEVNKRAGERRRSDYELRDTDNMTVEHHIRGVSEYGMFNVCVWVEGAESMRQCVVEGPFSHILTPEHVVATVAPDGDIAITFDEPRHYSPKLNYDVLVSEKEMDRKGVNLQSARVFVTEKSPFMVKLEPSEAPLYVAVRLCLPSGHLSDLSEVVAVHYRGMGESAASVRAGWGSVWYGVVGACAAALVLGAALLHLALKHRRLTHSFLRFTAGTSHHAPHVSRYDSRRGQATIADHEEDETPQIHGFSDDEPLVIA